MTARVVMYSTAVCPYCRMAEQLLKSRGVTDIEKILIDANENLRAEMIGKTNRRTVPQIFIGDTHVGGSTICPLWIKRENCCLFCNLPNIFLNFFGVTMSS